MASPQMQIKEQKPNEFWLKGGSMNIQFLEWVLKKYGLPKLGVYVKNVGWTRDSRCHWNRIGVPKKFKIILQQDITILVLTNKVNPTENKHLDTLLIQYKLELTNRKTNA